MSTTELAKTYDPSAVEAEAYRIWIEENCFTADPAKPGEPYSIVIPPPNVTGALHLGHAINNTLQDILTRMHRMAGFNTVWIPGIDHAGIATQAVVERQLKEKENKTRHDVGREALVARIWEWKQQYGDRILEQLKRLGCSCDWTRTRFTLDEMCAKAVRETFFKLFKDGLIYRGKRLVNWDVLLHTSISDDEIYHETVKTSLWHIRYPIEGTREFMTVATTRPETMLGDTAVAVHSADARWNQFIGEQVRLPLTDRLVPIIADDILVDPKFGSGVVKVTPAHDPNDYAVYQRHLSQPDAIDIINLLNPDGTLNANAGAYAGMKREAARKKVVADLEAQGLLVKEEPYETQVGHSDRSKTPIEPYLSDQWFVKMAPLAEPALQVVRDGRIKFFPERHAQQYLAWLGEKRDWPISRQLWWGHRIPVWRFRIVIKSPLDQSQDIRGALIHYLENYLEEFLPDGDYSESLGVDPLDLFVCARTDEAASVLNELGAKAFSQNESDRFSTGLAHLVESIVQDPDVLDTWFSSALWPHSTLGWPERTADLAKWYPTSVLLTGRDIITLWVARMVMMGIYNMGTTAGDRELDASSTSSHPHLARREHAPGSRETTETTFPESNGTPFPKTKTEFPGTTAPEFPELNPSQSRDNPASVHAGLNGAIEKALGIPFFHVAINPTILDGKGERMSKSKGNGVDPVEIIDGYGADALRFTLTTMATETQDARMPVKKDATGRNTSDKFDLGRNFCNKLWNAARFVLSNLETTVTEPTAPESTGLAASAVRDSLPDRWIISRFNRAVEETNTALAIYRFDQYAKVCYDFFWRDFCDWYVEAVKPAMKDPARSQTTSAVLTAMLDGVLRLMHPMIPFITETIWWRLNEVRPQRGITDESQETRDQSDRPSEGPTLVSRLSSASGPPSKRLILAPWPTVGPFDIEAETTFPRLQEIIVAIRNIRNQYKVDVRKPVTVSLAASPEMKLQIDPNRQLIELLATCTLVRVEADLPAPANCARATAAGCEIFVEGVTDPEAEKHRQSKRREELLKQRTALRGRLANEAYISKAPAELVRQTQQQLADAEAELAKLG